MTEAHDELWYMPFDLIERRLSVALVALCYVKALYMLHYLLIAML